MQPTRRQLFPALAGLGALLGLKLPKSKPEPAPKEQGYWLEWTEMCTHNDGRPYGSLWRKEDDILARLHKDGAELLKTEHADIVKVTARKHYPTFAAANQQKLAWVLDIQQGFHFNNKPVMSRVVIERCEPIPDAPYWVAWQRESDYCWERIRQEQHSWLPTYAEATEEFSKWHVITRQHEDAMQTIPTWDLEQHFHTEAAARRFYEQLKTERHNRDTINLWRLWSEAEREEFIARHDRPGIHLLVPAAIVIEAYGDPA